MSDRKKGVPLTTNDYPVVRRWRGNRCTLTVHEPGCRSVKPAEIAFYQTAESVVLAESQAFKVLRREVELGTSHWGPICRECDPLGGKLFDSPIPAAATPLRAVSGRPVQANA